MFHHRLAERDLTIARQYDFALVPEAENRCRVRLRHGGMKTDRKLDRSAVCA
jgi:hypothetical protein